jgi:intracellular septation protein A
MRALPRLVSLLTFLFANFGPLIAFYVTNHFWGLKPAIATSLIFSAIEVTYKLIKKEPLSFFFWFCVVMTFGFGMVDLYLQKSVLFKFEPAVTNLCVAAFFGVSVYSKKSLIQEMAEKSGKAAQYNDDHFFYFRVFTAIWALYYVVKSILYFWMGFHYTLEQGLLIRMSAGGISDYVFVGVSVLGGRYLFRFLQAQRLLPSQRRTSARNPAS